MVYSGENVAVIRDKHQFFSNTIPKDDIPTAMSKIDISAKNKEQAFLFHNQKALEREFTEMFSALENQKTDNREQFWFYCYYCASLLEAFYTGYQHQAQIEKFAQLKKRIAKRLQNKKQKDADENFIQSLQRTFMASLRNLLTSPIHVSRIRDYVAFTNLCRIYWIFCRLTLIQGFNFAKNSGLLDKIDTILGTHTDVDSIISTFQAPTGVLNYFSVALFLARFMIDFGLLLRHTFFPTQQEKAEGVTAWDRFKYELYKRHCNFINDLVWATVNFITNFNYITHIPGPIADLITAVFLGFDVGMTLYKSHLAQKEYQIKKEQYQAEMKAYSDEEAFMHLTEDERLLHIDMLNKQLIELEIDWRSKESTYHFVAAAAALLMLGFTAALIISTPIVLAACYFVCTVAVAMYISSGAYSKYQEVAQRLAHTPETAADHAVRRKEYEVARNEFIFTMIKNTAMPLILIATFAVCWQAAVVLTALYIGYEIYHAHCQHLGNNAVKELAVNETTGIEDETVLNSMSSRGI